MRRLRRKHTASLWVHTAYWHFHLLFVAHSVTLVVPWELKWDQSFAFTLPGFDCSPSVGHLCSCRASFMVGFSHQTSTIKLHRTHLPTSAPNSQPGLPCIALQGSSVEKYFFSFLVRRVLCNGTTLLVMSWGFEMILSWNGSAAVNAIQACPPTSQTLNFVLLVTQQNGIFVCSPSSSITCSKSYFSVCVFSHCLKLLFFFLLQHINCRASRELLWSFMFGQIRNGKPKICLEKWLIKTSFCFSGIGGSSSSIFKIFIVRKGNACLQSWSPLKLFFQDEDHQTFSGFMTDQTLHSAPYSVQLEATCGGAVQWREDMSLFPFLWFPDSF